MTTVNEFAGNWTYRSFNNEPELDVEADGLLVATGDLTLEVEGSGGALAGLDLGGIGLDLGGSKISGRVSFGSIYLTVSGTAKAGTAKPDQPPTIRYRATGVEGTVTAGWIYDFVGYLTPSWPEGVGQRPAIVGTVIRTVEHMGGPSGDEVRPAGATLSFIAVSA